ncbi:MAG: LL-diaminopimelate aminotransferase [Gemmatimonadota bacterium]|nr:MAG: LL-diaminopimelate aminotransferase [Gemmatimonadota bacterium]
MKNPKLFIGAKRLAQLPPYLFAELDRKKRQAVRSGRDVIDLGVGDPDMATPSLIIQRLRLEAARKETHRYPSYNGLQEFREVIADWFESRFSVPLDPNREVLVLIGSKEGLGHLPWALLDPGETAIIPNPAYPVYENGTLLAGGKPFRIPLLEEDRYLPDLEAIAPNMADAAKLLYLNYPNNPTGAVADADFFQSVVDWAVRYNVVICHDAAYTEIAFNGYRPPSLLSVAGAKKVGVEFHSLSKTFNMTGWRVGFAVGNADVIKALGEIKKNVDSGVFGAVQYAGIEALDHYSELIDDIRMVYQDRRDVLVEGLTRLGWKLHKTEATFYVWARPPVERSSTQLAERLLEETAIAVAPGVGFGTLGEGYIRFSLTNEKSRIEEAVDRIKKVGF